MHILRVKLCAMCEPITLNEISLLERSIALDLRVNVEIVEVINRLIEIKLHIRHVSA